MPDRCKQCGAALTERDAFCTKCGAQCESANQSASERFCTKCGAALATATKFCTKCGAEVGTGAASSVSASIAAQKSDAHTPDDRLSAQNTSQRQFPSPSPASRMPKTVILGALAIVVVLIIGGIISAVHHARERAQEREAAQSFEKTLKNIGAGSKASDAKGQANSSSDADLQKNLAQMEAAANALGATSGNAGANSAAPNSGAANATPASAKPAAPYGWTLENGKLVPAKGPAALPMPKADPVEPVVATGDQTHDWALKYERTLGGPEADLVVRTGDINNLGFGWKYYDWDTKQTKFLDPFSGKSTQPHAWPDINKIPPGAPDGTDRIMLGTSVMPVHFVTKQTAGQPDQITLDSITQTIGGDGYSGALGDCYSMRDRALFQMPEAFRDRITSELSKKFVLNNLPDAIRNLAPSSLQSQLPGYFKVDQESATRCTRDRALTMPTPIVLPVGSFRFELHSVVVQIFVDDFQPLLMHSHFQVSLNGTRIPSFEYAINSLDQSGPIGKLLTLKLLPEYFPLIESGTVKLLIDDPTTRVQDGYAIDFVRILLNPYKFKYQVSLTARVLDADKSTPISGASVTAALESAATDTQGKCELKDLPAGLVIATASAPGYDETSVPVDLPAGQVGNAEIRLHRHQESTAALEQSIAQTGSATIYGIHFDTNSSKLRPDSLPALNAVLGLVKNHPGSHWIISGHTDNQGNAALNQPLSEARAKSVVAWLKQHGADVSRLAPEGFGATRPVADNATANGRALNRRVEVSLEK